MNKTTKVEISLIHHITKISEIVKNQKYVPLFRELLCLETLYVIEIVIQRFLYSMKKVIIKVYILAFYYM